MSDVSIEFVHEDEDKKPQRKQRVPADYIPVKLSSLGRLDAPSILHVKDYSGKDALDLSLAATTENVFLRRLVEVINGLIFEGFDCTYLHENELEELMLNITANFATPVIHDYPYPYEQEEYDSMDDDRKERIKEGQETLTVDIPITSINTTPISTEFQEPITIKNSKGFVVKFRLPRLGDYFIAEDYIEKKYEEEAQIFVHVDKIAGIEDEEERDAKLLEIPKDILKAYRDYMTNRGLDYIVAKQSQLIVAIGNKKLETSEEKINQYSQLSMRFWEQYNELCDKHLRFGVDHNIKMISPITKEPVVRRCQFRPMDYVSANNIQESGEFTILFG